MDMEEYDGIKTVRPRGETIDLDPTKLLEANPAPAVRVMGISFAQSPVLPCTP